MLSLELNVHLGKLALEHRGIFLEEKELNSQHWVKLQKEKT